MPVKTCVACGDPVSEGADRCGVCHAPVFEEERRRLGLSAPTGWVRPRRAPTAADRREARRKVLLVLGIFLLTMILARTAWDFGPLWLGFAIYVVGGLVVLGLIRRDEAEQRPRDE